MFKFTFGASVMLGTVSSGAVFSHASLGTGSGISVEDILLSFKCEIEQKNTD